MRKIAARTRSEARSRRRPGQVDTRGEDESAGHDESGAEVAESRAHYEENGAESDQCCRHAASFCAMIDAMESGPERRVFWGDVPTRPLLAEDGWKFLHEHLEHRCWRRGMHSPVGTLELKEAVVHPATTRYLFVPD